MRVLPRQDKFPNLSFDQQRFNYYDRSIMMITIFNINSVVEKKPARHRVYHIRNSIAHRITVPRHASYHYGFIHHLYSIYCVASPPLI